jgi:glucose dehydrogenase
MQNSMTEWERRLFRALILLAWAVLSTSSQNKIAATGADWPTYNHDLASSRYSSLTQISPANAGKLIQAWSYRLRPGPNSPAAGTMNEVTPIVAGGVMYLPAGNRVVALEPESGKEITAVPITYQGRDGKQYVAVVAAGGGRGNSQALVAFALPKKTG